MLKLASTPLLLSIPGVQFADLELWVRSNIPIERACPWVLRSWPGPRLVNVSYPTGFRDTPEIRLNVFTFPTWGAARFGYGFYVADSDSCDIIRKAAFGTDGRGMNRIGLTMNSPPPGADEDDPAIETVNLNVYLLPPVPLGREDPVSGTASDGTPATQSVNGLYLLTVVDPRYYWWNVATPDFGIDGTTKTWNNVIKSIKNTMVAADAIKDLTWPTVPLEYVRPHPALNLMAEVIPPVIDCVAENIGMRAQFDPFTRILNFQQFDAAQKIRNDADTTHAAAGDRSLRAGGELFNDVL